MKHLLEIRILSRAAAWALTAVAVLLGVFPGHAAAEEPVLGTWKWDNSKKNFTLQADGVAVQKGRKGSWVCLDSNPTSRTYQLNWDNGKFIDTLHLVDGGAALRGQNQQNYKLLATRVGPAPVSAAPPPPPPTVIVEQPATVSVTVLDRFYEQLPKAAEWALAPLDVPVPATVRTAILAMDYGLREEVEHHPQANLETYQAAVSLCQRLLIELNERESRLRQNAQINHGAGLSDSWKKNWDERVFVTGPLLERTFGQFVEVAHASPKPTVATGAVVVTPPGTAGATVKPAVVFVNTKPIATVAGEIQPGSAAKWNGPGTERKITFEVPELPLPKTFGGGGEVAKNGKHAVAANGNPAAPAKVNAPQPVHHVVSRGAPPAPWRYGPVIWHH